MQTVSNNEQSFFRSPAFLITTALWIVYVMLTFSTPQSAASRAQLGLSDTAIFFLRITIVLPYLLIWLAVPYSIRALRHLYSNNAVGGMARMFSSAFLTFLVGSYLHF